MNVLTKENTTRVLSDLVGLRSDNPMDRPFTGTERVEKGVADYIEELFARYDVCMRRTPISNAHENLLIEVPGRRSGPATLFESHMDTVPADDWLDRAFTPRQEGDRIVGRGACDDKGCLTAMILAVQDLLESGELPPLPVLLLAAGDEEYAQTGIKLFREESHTVGRAVFGEPTRLRPVIQHKGTLRWDITVHGRSAHTSRPQLGENAILGAMQIIADLAIHQRELGGRYINPLLTGPTLTVTMIHGGRTRNAVPDLCTFSIDYRLLPGMDPDTSLQEVFDRIAAFPFTVSHSALQLKTPPLNTSPDDPFSHAVLEVCRGYAGAATAFEGAPYGTDAAWVADRCPAIVLGPGDIAYAHAIDESIDVNEVLTCAHIYRDILARDYGAAESGVAA